MGLLSILGIVERIVDKAIPDAGEKARMKLELSKLADAEAQREHEQLMGQIEVNKVEAGHRSIFVAGWRPAIGWVGASSLAAIFVVQPIVQLATGEPVTLDTSELMVLVGGLLGFGGMRTFDKIKGVANDAPLGKKADDRLPTPEPRTGPIKILPEDVPWKK